MTDTAVEELIADKVLNERLRCVGIVAYLFRVKPNTDWREPDHLINLASHLMTSPISQGDALKEIVSLEREAGKKMKIAQAFNSKLPNGRLADAVRDRLDKCV